MQIVDKYGNTFGQGHLIVTSKSGKPKVPTVTVAWGNITGILSNQTDLQNALNLKVPTARTITINGNTQDLSADRTWTISTGITVNTTPITGGSTGRLLFDNAGVVSETNGAFWDVTNKRVGIGTTNPGLPLHVVGGTRLSFTTTSVVHGWGNTLLDLVGNNGTNPGVNEGRLHIGYNQNDPELRVNSGGVIVYTGKWTFIPQIWFAGGITSTHNTAITIDGMTNGVSSGTAGEIFRFTQRGGQFGSFYDAGGGLSEFRIWRQTDNSKYIYLKPGSTSIISSGSLLINTTTDAGYKLDVSGIIRSAGANGLILSDGTYAAKTWMNSYIYTIEKEGSYGISTYQLKYNDTTDALYLNSTSIRGDATYGVVMSRSIYAPHNGAFGFLTYGSTTQYTAIKALYTDNNSSGIAFNYKTANVDTEAMRITSTGTVGIGTTTLGTTTQLTIGGAQTASSAIARGQLINTTLVAAANNDVLVGLDVQPTFTNGAFTGVSNFAARFGGDVVFTSGNRNIRILSPSTTGDGGSIVIAAGNATTSGTGGSITLSEGLGAGGPGRGSINIGTSGYTTVNIGGANVTVTNSGPNTGTAFRVLAGGQNGLSIYWDNLTPFMQYGLVSGRQSRFVNSTSYTFSSKVFIGTNTDAGFTFDVNGTSRFTQALTVNAGGIKTESGTITGQTGVNSGRMTMFSLNNTGGGYLAALNSSLAIGFQNRDVGGLWSADFIELKVYDNSTTTATTGYNFYTHNQQAQTASSVLAMSIRGQSVGIGTENPSALLEVNGSARVQNGLTVSGSLNLNSSDISSAWIAYTPTWSTDGATQPSLGDGTITGAYKVIGKTVFVRVRLVFGTTTTAGTGTFYFSLPVNAAAAWGVQMPVSILDNGNAWYQATVNGEYGGFTDRVALITQSAGGANSSQGVTGVFPITFANTDSIQFNGSYESA